MPVSSGWPLKPGAIRYFVPHFASAQLARHPLTEELHITGMGFYPRAHNHTMTRLEHEDNLLMYCSEGNGWLTLNEVEYPVHAGDLMVLPKGLPHHYRADLNTPWSLRWVHFAGSRALDYIANLHLPTNCFVIAVGQHPRIISDFDTLFSVRETGYNMKALIHASQALKQMLTYLALLSASQSRQARQPIDLENIQALMMANLAGELDLHALAEAAHLSKYHFAKRYKALTGYSPIQHFIHMKMERACYLLDTNNQPVSRVAQALGYDDPQYFSRLFRKVTGLSPRDYRKLDKG
ncbi:MAG: AraC family transcriptional regulator [Pseudomonadales bacterium]|jgi:AraC family transcriptional regulator, arabinose operon regulatory protein|uniref:helix-turn-helix domain-containing protein n=1 Tax=unclassified Ketobacter TaxID=2639109 RepID=UPI000C682232|nr:MULTISPECIES: helix-turn-helix domain-containing protein [unclassified Ketobacter]MAA60455.1 AraC family transcriptional regulator [Pseudomonadales bacterium]MEC8813639.1 helix-turn-helix domain-containing protein [Pseudomonadota bacterium]TNC89589.1 MAG: AraC family transcriptional regulator [Alcanivorax sp.]HAG97003.1 AraC family transcriptional regulator [Gammaproteobacteria bacterium]MAQ27172.1 AraC family transcriptional regulator [Pseudomonadales bacterium]|tara:strand:+ start:143 stop:1024 length:882 start_codon:yes stop_codon:yes gene_type:complete